jgi:hypothetical protein
VGRESLVCGVLGVCFIFKPGFLCGSCNVLSASYSSMVLSWRLRALAHFANSSCELVLFISRFCSRTARFSSCCLRAVRDVGVGRRRYRSHNWRRCQLGGSR